VLRWRLLSAILIIAPLLGLMVADFSLNFGAPGLWLVPLALLLTAMAVAEVLDLLRSQDLRPASWSVHAGAQLVVIAGMVPAVVESERKPLPGRFCHRATGLAFSGT
jgi:hypothetical protein